MKNFVFRTWYYFLISALPMEERAPVYDFVARYSLGLPIADGEREKMQAFFPALDDILLSVNRDRRKHNQRKEV